MQNGASRPGICLALAALALASAGIGCGEGSYPTHPAQLLNGGSGSPVTAGGAADAPLPAGLQLAAVRRATALFHDVAAAYAAGYTTENEPCVASPDGVMGIHAPNLSLIGDQRLEPTQPEALLYLPRPDGGLRLIGVEYVQIVLLRNPATNEVAPWVSEDPWPVDFTVVTPTPRLFGQTFQGPMPGHTPTMPWHWDLHAWIWAPNPNGLFAEWNPTLECN